MEGRAIDGGRPRLERLHWRRRELHCVRRRVAPRCELGKGGEALESGGVARCGHHLTDLLNVARGRRALRVVALRWESHHAVACELLLPLPSGEPFRPSPTHAVEKRGEARAAGGGVHQGADHGVTLADMALARCRPADRRERVGARRDVKVLAHLKLRMHGRRRGHGGVDELRVHHTKPAGEHAGVGAAKRHPLVLARRQAVRVARVLVERAQILDSLP